jgi:hypothetical protein
VWRRLSARSWVLDAFRQVDSGALRVAWANYQVRTYFPYFSS